jgi:redox-sensitive bicupin YhaK (pirin superfamily)
MMAVIIVFFASISSLKVYKIEGGTYIASSSSVIRCIAEIIYLYHTIGIKQISPMPTGNYLQYKITERKEIDPSQQTKKHKHKLTTAMASNRIIQVRKSLQRGHANHGWLNTYHTFSFADYYHPKFNSFGSLRVLNEDIVQPGEGFGKHPHRNFEIYSYVVSGELEHKDSMGNVEILKRGDVQLTSAGSGISHSEYNRNTKQAVHFLQIWVVPDKMGLTPSYQTKHFSEADKLNNLLEFMVPKGSDNKFAISMNQDFYCYSSLLESGKRVKYDLRADRKVYVHVVNHNNKDHQLIISTNKQSSDQVVLSGGDGAFIEISGRETGTITFESGANSTSPVEFLVFDTDKYANSDY